MAQSVMMTYPLDTPRTIAPGELAPERNAPGNAQWLSLPPEAPQRAAKGDLGMSVIKDFDSRPLTSPGAPFTNLRGGK